MTKVFGHGDLRLYLLHLLESKPRHGYELIRLLEDRFLGVYTPSAGTVYPRLAALVDDGLIEFDEIEGRKVYRLTDAGRAELDDRRDELGALEVRVVGSARDMTRDLRDEVRATAMELKREIRSSVREVQREQRRVVNEARRQRVRATTEARDTWRELRVDLQAFVADIAVAARRHHLDADRLATARAALLQARAAVLDAVAGRGPDVGGQEEATVRVDRTEGVDRTEVVDRADRAEVVDRVERVRVAVDVATPERSDDA